jgi:glucokinase
VASGAGIEGRLGIEAGSLARFAADHPDRAWPVVEESAQILGEGLASVMNVLNPPLVVIGGGVAELGPRYIDAVARASREVALPEIAGACRFEVARAGYEAGAVGAAHFARRRCTPRRAPRGQGGAAIAG